MSGCAFVYACEGNHTTTLPMCGNDDVHVTCMQAVASFLHVSSYRRIYARTTATPVMISSALPLSFLHVIRMVGHAAAVVTSVDELSQCVSADVLDGVPSKKKTPCCLSF